MSEIEDLLDGMKAFNASDLHLKVGNRPRYRVDGELIEVAGYAVHDCKSLSDLLASTLDEEKEKRFREDFVLHMSFGREESSRFRACYFWDHNGPAAVYRRLSGGIPSLRGLGLPKVAESFAHKHRGLVLVTGATGTGKSTTLAALINLINAEYRKFIITLEDPIQYVYEVQKSIIYQRGLHHDFHDFQTGLSAALDQNPDVLLVEELRSRETIRLALSAAEQGHLVFATLHTNGAIETVDRILDVFDSDERPQVALILSHCLEGILSQTLLRKAGKAGRVAATEVLVGTTAARNLIREGKIGDLANVIQSGRALGMHTMDDSLESLVTDGRVDAQEAYFAARNKLRFERFLKPKSASFPFMPPPMASTRLGPPGRKERPLSKDPV